MACGYLLTLTALMCCVKDIQASTYTILVNNVEVRDPNGVRRVDARSEVQVACRVESRMPKPSMLKIRNQDETSLAMSLSEQYRVPNYVDFVYLLNEADKRVTATYRCIDERPANCPDYSQVTIGFVRTPSAGPIISNGCPPGGSTATPSSPSPSLPSSSSGTSGPGPAGRGTSGPGFAGLNPLIYTICAVFLLGTLAIVSIITCWIRARRSYNRRMFQSTANPQDYLDYISDNEFTPLTTSEFVASLQERPPTYNESEEIEGQMRPEGDDDGASTGEGGARERENTQTSASTTSTNARNLPPRPPPPSTSNRSHSTTPTSSRTTPTTSSCSETAPEITSEERPPANDSNATHTPLSGPSRAISRPTVAGDDDENVPDITNSNEATMASVLDEPISSGIDALLSIDLSTGNGNGTRTLPTPSASSATESAALGTLIDFESSNTSAPVLSDSQATFHSSLPQPTPEQISEIEAAIGRLNKHMTRIRERTE